MATNIEANNINADIKDWCVIDGKLQKLHEEDRLRRAGLVIQWAWANRGGVRPLIKPEHLSAAMNVYPYWRQGPSDYLDMMDAIEAVLKMLPEQKELF